MNELQHTIKDYLDFCQKQKRLDSKTRKAYRIDLKQFAQTIPAKTISDITPSIIEMFICHLHESYKPKTAKRKIATIKAFFLSLVFQTYTLKNP